MKIKHFCIDGKQTKTVSTNLNWNPFVCFTINCSIQNLNLKMTREKRFFQLLTYKTFFLPGPGGEPGPLVFVCFLST